MPAIYGPEPVHGWCYYFERAGLAAQMKDWTAVTELGNAAFLLDDFPNDPVERFVFIEGYAHKGNWERALELSTASYRVSPDYVGPLLCPLWDRIRAQTDPAPTREANLAKVKSMFACAPE